MSFTSHFVQANEIRLHYLQWESIGSPVLIVHGNTHCGGVYAPLAERLAPDYSVIAVDLRGHGLSDRGDSYGWAALRDDLVGLIDALDLRDLLVVAHSRGGGASLLAAAARPERVRGVVAYEPNVPLHLWHSESPEERVAALSARALRRRDTFPDGEAMYDHFKGRGAFKDWQDEYLRAYVEHCSVELLDGGIGLASPTTVEAEMYRAMFDLTAWHEVRACPVPVLAVYGEDGGRITPGEDPVGALRGLFLDVSVKTQPRSTHSGPMEHPELFEGSIREFVSSLTQRRPSEQPD